ncbi:22503_t:CDS:2, partial [Gigaspora margarita]
SKKDLNNALSSTVWYYDTKLEWINGRGFLNQGTQGAEAYAEAIGATHTRESEKKSTNRNITIAAHNINVTEVQENWYDSTLDLVKLEE